MSTSDPRRGEVWLADLDPTRGAEMAKFRPVVVMSPDDVGRLPLRVVVPITDWKDRYDQYPWMTRIEADEASGLSKTSAADAFQVRSLSVLRLKKSIGALDRETVEMVAEAVALAVGLSHA